MNRCRNGKETRLSAESIERGGRCVHWQVICCSLLTKIHTMPPCDVSSHASAARAACQGIWILEIQCRRKKCGWLEPWASSEKRSKKNNSGFPLVFIGFRFPKTQKPRNAETNHLSIQRNE